MCASNARTSAPSKFEPIWGAGPEAWPECLVGTSLLDYWPRRAPTPTPPDSRCLHQLFEAHAAVQPEAEALVAGSERLTYGMLNTRANRIAHQLRALGVGRETMVGIFLGRSADMIVALLAVLKAGGAYLPLDPAYPTSRLAFMLGDVQAHTVLTHAALSDALLRITAEAAAKPHILCLDDDAPPGPDTNPEPLAESGDLAYVIYTSGSTGQPKGVGLEHRSAVAFTRWAGTWFNSHELGGVLASTSICFDVSMFETLATLGLGGRLILAANALELPALPAREEVRMIVTSPSVMREILRMGPLPASVVSFAIAGEALDAALVRKLYELPHVERVYDLYGPTETTTYSTAALRRANGPTTIGRPIDNTRIHLLDESLQPVLPGKIGEIFIGGAGVARGYLNRPDLTALKFLPDPFSTDPAARLYRTGDLGRWRPDGDLEYLGRVDHQVKIHGFRIELGEIESVLRGHPGISETVVVAREDRPGDRRLVAYVVPGPASDGEATVDQGVRLRRELRTRLGENLPHYMVPGAIVFLERLPLTPNGKLDRAALPAPSRSRAPGTDYVSPSTAHEETLCRLWAEVLDVPSIGASDDFLQLGGDSLLAVKLVIAVEQQFGVKLPPGTIFQAPTVQKFASLIAAHAPAAVTPSLLPLQPGSAQPALYLVHGIGGGMLWGYTNLARHLDPDQPVYAFQATDSTADDTLERMAAHYLRELRAFQPEGPYCLGGFCFGGNVAFEMARQLEADGQKVGLLVLINSTPPNSDYEYPRWSPALVGGFTANVVRWLRRFAEWDAGNRRKFVSWKFRTLRQHASRFLYQDCPSNSAIDDEAEINLADVPLPQRPLWNAHLEAQRRHHPKRYRGHVTLLRTSAHQFFCSFDREFGWGAFATGGVSVCIVPGLHQSMLQEPQVQVLARVLQTRLAAMAADLERGAIPAGPAFPR